MIQCAANPSVHVPVIVVSPHVRAQPLPVVGQVGLDLSIAKEGEPVAEPILDVVIFISRFLD
jgi:hypothetical protein